MRDTSQITTDTLEYTYLTHTKKLGIKEQRSKKIDILGKKNDKIADVNSILWVIILHVNESKQKSKGIDWQNKFLKIIIQLYMSTRDTLWIQRKRVLKKSKWMWKDIPWKQ